MDIESEPESSLENFWLGKLNINDNPTYEVMNKNSTISASLLKPQRNNCSRCDQSALIHFFIICSYCANLTCCQCIFESGTDVCDGCKKHFSAKSEVLTTILFNKHISQHNCSLTASKPEIFYNSVFKTILINPCHFEDHKEIFNPIDSFIQIKLNQETANYTVRRVLQILNSLQTSHLPYYDKLFHKHFSFPYNNDLKK